MKNFILKLIVFSFLTATTAQDLKVIVTYQKALKSLKNQTTSIPKTIDGLEYVLMATDRESMFFFENSLPLRNNFDQRFKGRAGGNGIYYNNLQNNVKIHQLEYFDQSFIIDKSLNKYDWVITNESKSIGKYQCYKAVATYEEYSKTRNKLIPFNITAWFTNDIPIPFGPAGYDGLPGLILELQNGGIYFIASRIKFSDTIEKLKIEKPTKGKKVTYTEFNTIIAKLIKDAGFRN